MAEERRKDYSDILSRIGDLEIQIALIGTKFDSSHRNFRDFQFEIMELNTKITNTLYGNGQPGLTTKVSNLDGIRNEIRYHSTTDKWVFGIVITVQMAILGGLFFK